MNNNYYDLLEENTNNERKNFTFNSKLVFGNDSPLYL